MAGGNSKISVGHIDSKFGISVHQVPHIKRVVKKYFAYPATIELVGKGK